MEFQCHSGKKLTIHDTAHEHRQDGKNRTGTFQRVCNGFHDGGSVFLAAFLIAYEDMMSQRYWS